MGPVTPLQPGFEATALLGDADTLRARFDADGCLLLPGLMTAEEVTPLALRARRVLAERGFWRDGAVARPTPAYDDPDFLALQQDVYPSPELDRLRRHPALLAVVRTLLGAEPVVGAGDIVRVRGPGAVTRPHQDRHYLPSEALRITAWICLEPCPLEQGPLAVLPGSHRDGLRGSGRPGHRSPAGRALGRAPPAARRRLAVRGPDGAPGPAQPHRRLPALGGLPVHRSRGRSAPGLSRPRGGHRRLQERPPTAQERRRRLPILRVAHPFPGVRCPPLELSLGKLTLRTTAVIKNLKRGEQIPYYFAEQGPGGAPFLLADSDDTKFDPKLKTWKEKCVNKKRVTKGVIKATDRGKVFVRDGELPRPAFKSGLKTLAEEPAFRKIKTTLEKPLIEESVTVVIEPPTLTPKLVKPVLIEDPESNPDVSSSVRSAWEEVRKEAKRLHTDLHRKDDVESKRVREVNLAVKTALSLQDSGKEDEAIEAMQDVIEVIKDILAPPKMDGFPPPGPMSGFPPPGPISPHPLSYGDIDEDIDLPELSPTPSLERSTVDVIGNAPPDGTTTVDVEDEGSDLESLYGSDDLDSLYGDGQQNVPQQNNSQQSNIGT